MQLTKQEQTSRILASNRSRYSDDVGVYVFAFQFMMSRVCAQLTEEADDLLGVRSFYYLAHEQWSLDMLGFVGLWQIINLKVFVMTSWEIIIVATAKSPYVHLEIQADKGGYYNAHSLILTWNPECESVFLRMWQALGETTGCLHLCRHIVSLNWCQGFHSATWSSA